MTTQTDPFLGGDSLPGASFPNVGDSITGQIVDMRQIDDKEPNGNVRKWDNGDTKKVWVFDLDTNQDGTADTSLWVRGHMYTVVREALRAAGLSTLGTIIKVTHSGLGEKKLGMNPAKLYTCQAKPGPVLVPKNDPFAGDSEEPF